MYKPYHRTLFKCEIVINENCEFFHNSQLLESSFKIDVICALYISTHMQLLKSQLHLKSLRLEKASYGIHVYTVHGLRPNTHTHTHNSGTRWVAVKYMYMYTYVHVYHIMGNFGGGFNLAILESTAKLKIAKILSSVHVHVLHTMRVNR